MFALPWNKVIIRRGGIELNPNAQLLPVPRARRYREPEAEPAVAKARMERVNAGDVPYALPCALPKAGDQKAIHQILAGPPAGAAPKRSNAANPLPATADPAAEECTFRLPKAAPFCGWHRSPNADPLPDPNGYIAKAGAALPPPTISPIVVANVLAMAPPPAGAAMDHAYSDQMRAAVAVPIAAPPAAEFPIAPRPLPPALYEDLRRRAQFLDDLNEGLAEPRTYNPHPISY